MCNINIGASFISKPRRSLMRAQWKKNFVARRRHNINPSQQFLSCLVGKGFIDAANLLAFQLNLALLPFTSSICKHIIMLYWIAFENDIYFRSTGAIWARNIYACDEKIYTVKSIFPHIDFYLLVIPWYCLFADWIYVNIFPRRTGRQGVRVKKDNVMLLKKLRGISAFDLEN
jgi:hypothetical protein